MAKSVLIIGAGQAGMQCALSLRQYGFDGPITLLGDESKPPYERPPLSKAALYGDIELDRTILRPEHLYQEKNIDLRLNVSATSIDDKEKTLRLSNGDTLTYNVCVLATGAAARQLPYEVGNNAPLFVLRDWADTERLQTFLKRPQNRPLAVIGAGFIGLEAASTVRKMGWEVLIIECAPRLMGRAVLPQISDTFADKHRQEGAQLFLDTSLNEVEETNFGFRLKTENGNWEVAGILAGIGAAPRFGLYETLGLTEGPNLPVNQYQQTSNPDLYAIGDVATQRSRFLADDVRLESVQNAIYSGKIAAAHIAGTSAPAREVPWFWTNQYDWRLQMVGLVQPHLEWITRGNPESDSFSLLGMEGNIMRAIQCLNASKDFALARRAIETEQELDKDALSDMDRKVGR